MCATAAPHHLNTSPDRMDPRPENPGADATGEESVTAAQNRMRWIKKAVGKVVRFDERRGFGFIAPIGGSEDVFLHVNDLLIPESLVRPGAMLEFDIDEGERGYQAPNISLPKNAEPNPPDRVAAATAAMPARAVAATAEGSTPTPFAVAAAG